MAPETTIPTLALEEAEKLLQLRAYDFDHDAVSMEWDAFEAWERREAFDKAHPKPALTVEKLAQVVRRQELEDEQARLSKSPVITCPCGKSFTTADLRLVEIEQELNGLPIYPGDIDVRTERRRIEDWSRPQTLREWENMKGIQEAPRPWVSWEDLQLAKRPGSIHKDDLVTALRNLAVPPVWGLREVRDALQAARLYEARVSSYEPQRATYDAWKADADVKAERVLELRSLSDTVPQLDELLREEVQYEGLLVRYEADLVAYEEKVAELAERRSIQASWRESRAGFSRLRDSIKSYLIPSLSRQASALLSHMTGGARQSIIVDEDFEVTVDGQPLATLSGSGMACANLALRIGLGQVLTNNVLSVFFGDEIDASMDESRADNLKTSLRMLKDRISQIIIVTHKSPEADHTIVLGDSLSGPQLHPRAAEEVGV